MCYKMHVLSNKEIEIELKLNCCLYEEDPHPPPPPPRVFEDTPVSANGTYCLHVSDVFVCACVLFLFIFVCLRICSTLTHMSFTDFE